MSKKKDRAWFICPQWAELTSQHYVGADELSQSLKVDPKVREKLRSRTPVARSTLLKILRRFAEGHDLGRAAEELIVDTRSR
jgi:hypothetical protein